LIYDVGIIAIADSMYCSQNLSLFHGYIIIRDVLDNFKYKITFLRNVFCKMNSFSCLFICHK